MPGTSETTPILRGHRVTLRGFMPADALARADLGEVADIVRMFGGSPSWTGVRPLELGDAEAWLAHVRDDGNPYHWAVEVEGRFVGTARLHNLDDLDRRARYAVGILDPNLLGQGLGQDVTACVLRFAFGDLDLHRVDLRVLAMNERAIASYRRSGFVEEGRERESVFIEGAWHDDVLMGILDHEFAATG